MAALAVLGAAAGCASRSADVAPAPPSAADFALWDCMRLQNELDRVQRRAADVAWDVDERAGHNIVALGVGMIVFWPAVLAMQPDGPEARELARLKGRDDALRDAMQGRPCPPPPADMAATDAAALPVAAGERLVYVERASPRRPGREVVLWVTHLRRDEIEFALVPPPRGDTEPRAAAYWRQDLAGNLSGAAPEGLVHWRRLLQPEMTLGQVVAGELVVGGDADLRARARGQVVALGPQRVAGRRFDAAVIELFGDIVRGGVATRLDGVLVVDRASGVLLRLDLSSADPQFSLRRQLERIEPAAR